MEKAQRDREQLLADIARETDAVARMKMLRFVATEIEHADTRELLYDLLQVIGDEVSQIWLLVTADEAHDRKRGLRRLTTLMEAITTLAFDESTNGESNLGKLRELARLAAPAERAELLPIEA